MNIRDVRKNGGFQRYNIPVRTGEVSHHCILCRAAAIHQWAADQYQTVRGIQGKFRFRKFVLTQTDFGQITKESGKIHNLNANALAMRIWKRQDI